MEVIFINVLPWCRWLIFTAIWLMVCLELCTCNIGLETLFPVNDFVFSRTRNVSVEVICWYYLISFAFGDFVIFSNNKFNDLNYYCFRQCTVFIDGLFVIAPWFDAYYFALLLSTLLHSIYLFLLRHFSSFALFKQTLALKHKWFCEHSILLFRSCSWHFPLAL